MAEDQLFYVAQKSLIEKDGEVLVLFDPDLGIDLPGGKIQIGEKDLLRALYREIKEETGLEVEIGMPIATDYFKFEKNIKHRHAGKIIFVVFFKAKYVSGKVRLSREHDKYLWINRNNYKKLKVINKRYNNIFNAIKTYFEKT